MVRLQTYTVCALGQNVQESLGSTATDMSQFWATYYATLVAKDATCDTTARATDYLKSPVPDTFVAVQTCYKDNAGNSALLSIVALFSLMFLLFWKFHFLKSHNRIQISFNQIL